MRLLLAEDDLDLVAILKKDLETAGYAVDVADNGIDAEYLGNEAIYDVAVLDLGLPRRNGIEVLNNWRAKGNNLPVVVLTARNAWHERVEGLKVGADDYLGKPFHVEELLARLTALLHRTSQQPGGTLRVCNMVLDEERQNVTTTDGLSHKLTGTEFRLLRYLLLHPGKVLSKSELTDHIYDQDSDKDSNIIEVYIRRLRKLMGNDCIETRRGQGYVFRDH
ncbi:MAG: DNA-binding response regulator [Gammaproteobacteria bacterium RIFCSPLOWO2_02_FULL_47_50]|nr:MAG: DNA-binding response regulator [Gammaproteobacteria bacterium RIFCSPLOWO2_01_FULL_47_190]OGT71517.1 MAG: DNA-binding response regulator [Gammaproteobacteria bacterium RIFCSPLOWO2_12_47_11]OGT80340.1 MAG: DNA-binding response regulator [Gammaproteobacteria bacterium RIFCSPLOWO2_02_FULL_47_50]OGT82900.1 MAG: DNA-binding response regulator [Gammaproteobacteria bacterium RIFCSPLOWO2_12_FULL_47_76]